MTEAKKELKLVLTDVRCMYVFAKNPNKKGKYGIRILVPKNNKKLVTSIQKLQRIAAKRKFGNDVKMGRLKLPLRDAKAEEFDGKEYKNMFFFNANGDRKPGIVNRHNDPADDDEISELCFSGAYFTVSVTFFGFDGEEQKGVAVGFNNLMLRKEGERLDGSTTAAEDFADYAADDDDEDFDGDDFDDDDDDW